ncbi:MAG: hypothetical protein H3Z52_09350 [archaeon]|nr:hypothetical protein [archaeon]
MDINEVKRELDYINSQLKTSSTIHEQIERSLQKLGSIGYPKDRIEEIRRQFTIPIDQRKPIEIIMLKDSISLEGPFLEMIWAAYQMMNGRKVVPRYETLGTHHDVLVQSYDHSILYECTGQSPMTQEKINRLRNDAFDLADRIGKMGEPPLKEVLLVSSS